MLNNILCERLNIDQRVCGPFNPLTNRVTEWYNQTLCTTIVKFVSASQNNWDKFLKKRRYPHIKPQSSLDKVLAV